jgi:hypothetical protein
MTEHTQPPKFDAGNWGQVARLAVAASVTLPAVTVAILLMADPPNQCPDWHLKNAHSTSLWQCVGMLTAPLNIFCCFIAVRWNRFVRTAIESMDPRGEALFGRMTPPAIPVTHIMVHVCVAMSFTFPVAAVLACHPVHRSLRPDSVRSKHSRSRVAR